MNSSSTGRPSTSSTKRLTKLTLNACHTPTKLQRYIHPTELQRKCQRNMSQLTRAYMTSPMYANWHRAKCNDDSEEERMKRRKRTKWRTTRNHLLRIPYTLRTDVLHVRDVQCQPQRRHRQRRHTHTHTSH